MKSLRHPATTSHYYWLAPLACLVILFTSGCRSTALPTQAVETVREFSPTVSPVPTLTSTVIPLLPTPLPSPTLQSGENSRVEVCSPLDGIPIYQLEELISNPFSPPPPGSDGPHQGIDLADIGVGGVAREGLQVNSVLPGKVAAVILDRFPYGNALLVETSLDSLPPGSLLHLSLPHWDGISPLSSALTCPELSPSPDWDREELSLYILYAHLQSRPSFEPEDEILCGQMIGHIGSSGNALNPHLHLELRAGPAGTRLISLAHYDPSASLDEMGAYCAWRVSGIFRLLDPMSLFSLP
jgi:murein DD-endopeptidase MepM/ murein hydrolase activator NlpD